MNLAARSQQGAIVVDLLEVGLEGYDSSGSSCTVFFPGPFEVLRSAGHSASDNTLRLLSQATFIPCV